VDTAECAQPKEMEDEDPNNSMSMLSGACSVALALEAAAAAALAAGSPAGMKPCEGPEACENPYLLFSKDLASQDQKQILADVFCDLLQC
jgi:hypothetical protein